MGSLDKRIAYYLSNIKKRMNMERIVKFILLAASYACSAGILLAVISFFTPIYGVYTKAVLLVVLFIIFGIALAVIRRPKLSYAAMKADSLGLHERAITALELAGDESAMAMLQKEDTLEYLEGLEYKKKIPIFPDKKYFIICFILIAAIISTGFVQNPMGDKALKLQELRELKKTQIKDIDKLIEKIDKDSKLTREQKNELEEKLAQIRKDIKASKDRKELEKSLERNQKKMELLSAKYDESKKDFDRVIDTLLKNKETKSIGELMKNKDTEAIKNSIKDLTNTLNSLNGEDKYKLSEDLSKLAEEIKSNQELKEALKKASDKLRENKNLSKEDLEELADAISELTKNENIKNALEEIAEELSNMNTNTVEVNGQEGKKQPDGEGTKKGTGGKDESGQKENNVQNGKGGQENENSSQQNGSGAGNGTDPGSEDQTPNSSEGTGLSSKDSSEKKTGAYEKIFTSKTLGGTGKRTDLNGQENKGGSSEITSGESSQTNKGNSVPYNQVFGEYKDEAFESMNTSNIPEGMKEIVKDYFSSLEE